MRRYGIVLSLVSLLAIPAGASVAFAQNPKPTEMTREELTSEVSELQRQLSVATDESARKSLSDRMAADQRRLQVGDFLPGDIVGLTVSGQEKWTGNFPVSADQMLELPGLDPIPLSGVLYTEAGEVIKQTVGEILRDPKVSVQPLLRVAILGSVGNPGFYDVPSNTLVSDAITLAGGPSSRADLGGIKLRRNGDTLMEGEELAFQSLSLAQVGALSGDEFFIPSEGTGFLGGVRTFGFLLGTTATTVFLITRFTGGNNGRRRR